MRAVPLVRPARHRDASPDRRAWIVSAVAHAGLLVVAWAASAFAPEPVEYEVVQIELVSPPPASAPEPVEEVSAPEEELQVETPDAEPEPDDVPLPEPTEEVTPPPEPEPDPPAEEQPPEPEPEPEAAPAQPEAEPEEETGQDLNIRLTGLQRDYPEYWGNIIRQIDRCFRGSRSRARVVLEFTILRDGTAVDIDVVESSGSLAFEISAIEAVECAGNGRFGPLPSDFNYDELPVRFRFDPSGGD